MGMQIWDAFPCDHYLSLVPWAWIGLGNPDAPQRLSLHGGVAPDVVASLEEAHRILFAPFLSAIEDVFCRRASPEDPSLRARLEDAYAELVNSRPHLRAHIRCGRAPDGTFQWEFPLDPTQRGALEFNGLRLVNAVTNQTMPFDCEQSLVPAVGKLLGFLDGTHTVVEVRKAAAATGPDLESELTRFMDLLHTQHCLTGAAHASVRARWLAETRDRDVVHLGHAGLLYRQRDQFLCFDPWLMPWFAEAAVPSLWGSLLPRPAAIFLTHEHNDHRDLRTLLHMPKDIPIIVPSRTNGRALYFDYLMILRQLGFDHVIELAHGERWTFDGGAVVSVPFYGEDPCDLELPRNCYLVVDRGRNTLVQADSGRTNSGRSPVKERLIDDLVQQYGPIATVFASQYQHFLVRGYNWMACLSHPGRWLEPGEDGDLPNTYLAQLAASAKARLFVSYATGGADWYPDHLPFTFSPSKPARTAFLTANWEPLDNLKGLLAPYGCGYHYSYALDIFRPTPDGGTEVVKGWEALDPRRLFGADSGD